MLISALSSWKRQLATRVHSGNTRRRKRTRCTPVSRLESLENRTLLSAVGGGWQPVEPLGALVFQQEFAGSLMQTIDVFSDDFESGTLGPEWSTFSSTPNGRIAVGTLAGPPHSGSFHLTMDAFPAVEDRNLNEAVLTLDLSGLTDVDLSFWHKSVNDEPVALPETFVNKLFRDGVSMSADGVTWHRLTNLNAANSPNLLYTRFSLDLDQAAANAGIALGPDFKIKFQQSDNEPFNGDGRTFDDVAVRTTSLGVDKTDVFLEGGQTLTLVATPENRAATLTVKVFDPANTLLATATASAAGESVSLQTIAIAADGDYRIEVSGDVGSDYGLTLFRNATVELVDSDDGAEQDAGGSFIELGSGRWGIVGAFGDPQPSPARTVFFGFEEFVPPPQAVSSLTATRDGIGMTISREDGVLFDIERFGPTVPRFNAQFHFNALSPFTGQPDDTSGSRFILDFSTPLSSVSVDMGEFGQDADQLQLLAYSGPGGTGQLLGQATATLPGGSTLFNFDTLTVSGNGIQSVVMIGGVRPDFNSVYYDNITVTTLGGAPLGQELAEPDVDEYLIDLTGRAGQQIDLVFSTDATAGSDRG